jgi:hypothetical protein
MDKYRLNKEEKEILKCLISKGTPEEIRIRLWWVCSGAYEQMKSNPTYYKDLLKLSKEVHSLYSNDIEKDLDRTNNNLLEKNQKYKDMLRNVLICYSIRNSSIGYCQGFNFIALRIIEIVKDEVIFILFIFK